MDDGIQTYQELKEVYHFMNRQMKRFEAAKELSAGIEQLLSSLGAYFSADTVQLYKKRQNDYLLTNRWSNYAQNDSDWVCEVLSKLEPRLSQAYLVCEENRKGEKLCVLPLLEKNRIFAVIVLVNPSEKRIPLLQEISDMLVSWLSSRLLNRDYISRDNRLQRLLSGLGNDYTAVYVINLDTDAFEIIVNQKSNNAAKLQKYRAFSDYLDKYADLYVLEESRADMKRLLRNTFLKKHFKTQKDLYFRFHTKPNAVGQTYFEVHAVREYEHSEHFVVMGFRCVDELVKKEQEYQRELDKAYQEARQQLDVISASIQGGIKISYDDPMYTFKYVSKQYASMLGYDSVDELMQASKGSIVGIAHPDDVESGIAEALKQYSVSDNYAITYRMKCKDGTWKYIEDHGHKVVRADGEVEHWNLILDINELVTKTIELERAKLAEEVKTEFLSRMSHDMRTPLNGIIGLLEQEDRHPDDLELITSNRRKAHIAAEHLLSLVNDVLELNQLDDQKLKLEIEPFNFITMLEDIKTVFDMRTAEQEVSVFIDESYRDIPYPCVLGSSRYVKQILNHVITNAIKYNKAGGSVWCQIEEKELDLEHVSFIIRVMDNGIGMREEFLSDIYKPFVQENCDARSVYTGTGLGMPIVKNLVERMNGTIEINSQVGVGTTVVITLPFEKEKKASEEASEEYCDLTGVRALLVEDNELNMEITRCMLEDKHMLVTEAYNGAEAVQLFEENPAGTFDVILMDIMMPVMDGLAAARTIRALDKEDAKTIPVFAVTANAFAEDREKSRQAGMNEHIAKPIQMQLLMSKISKYCRGHRTSA